MTLQEVLLLRIYTMNVRDKMRAEKYLRKNCYLRIEYSAVNSLTSFIGRRLLNSAALVTPTYRVLVRVSDGTNTQVVTQMINKWRVKIA